MILLIDNYDSFTYNLYQYLAELGAEVLVERNDELTIKEIQQLAPDKIVISPGPRTPREAGISTEAILRLGQYTPILGVCLGHQCIGYAFGARVEQAGEIIHGKTSAIYHDGKGVLSGLINPLFFKLNRSKQPQLQISFLSLKNLNYILLNNLQIHFYLSFPFFCKNLQ